MQLALCACDRFGIGQLRDDGGNAGNSGECDQRENGGRSLILQAGHPLDAFGVGAGHGEGHGDEIEPGCGVPPHQQACGHAPGGWAEEIGGDPRQKREREPWPDDEMAVNHGGG